MTLEEIKYLIQQFKNRTLPKEDWTHEAHLIVALWFVKNHTISAATCLIRAGIISYNVAVGTPNTATRGYHETITLFWIWLVDEFISKHPALEMDQLVATFLQSKYAHQATLFEYYTKELLFSVEARANWVAPDLKKLEIIY